MRLIANTLVLSIMLTMVALMAMTNAGAVAAEPVRLIFDTDICGDCDDVLALGMIHALQSRGQCRLLAVTISVDHALAAPFVDAVNYILRARRCPDRRRGQRRRHREKRVPVAGRGTGERPLPLSPRRADRDNPRKTRRRSCAKPWQPSPIIPS